MRSPASRILFYVQLLKFNNFWVELFITSPVCKVHSIFQKRRILFYKIRIPTKPATLLWVCFVHKHVRLVSRANYGRLTKLPPWRNSPDLPYMIHAGSVRAWGRGYSARVRMLTISLCLWLKSLIILAFSINSPSGASVRRSWSTELLQCAFN